MAKFDKGQFTIVPSKEARNGMHPTLQCVYMWLCDHSDSKMQSFPSRKVLAAEAGISVDTLDRALAKLEELGMIKKEARYNDGEQMSNLYTVNMITTLRKTGGEGGAKTTPPSSKSPTQNSTQLTQPNSISKDIGASSLTKPAEKKVYGNPEVNTVIESFSSLTGLRLTKIAEQRRYASLLIKAHGLENVLAGCAVVAATIEDQYAPRISDIKSMYYKFSDLQLYARKKAPKETKQPVDLDNL